MYIIFFTENKYLILLSISVFLYTLWILPYLQIKNFFGWDSKLLYDLYQSYLNFGLKAENNYSLTQNIYNVMVPHRYSTNIFTTILLVNATQINVSFVLWFIFPLSRAVKVGRIRGSDREARKPLLPSKMDVLSFRYRKVKNVG